MLLYLHITCFQTVLLCTSFTIVLASPRSGASPSFAQVEDGVLDLLEILDLLALVLELLLLLAQHLLLTLCQGLQVGALLPQVITLEHILCTLCLLSHRFLKSIKIVPKTTRTKPMVKWFSPENLSSVIWTASRTDTNLQVTIETFLSNIKCIKMYKNLFCLISFLPPSPVSPWQSSPPPAASPSS